MLRVTAAPFLISIMATPIPEPSQIFAQIKDIASDPRVVVTLRESMSIYADNLGWLKAVSIFITAFFVAATIFFAVKTGWLAVKVDRLEDILLKSNIPKKRSIKAWNNIKTHFFAGDERDLKIAIIEADNLLDEALRLTGFRGATLGDKLKMLDESRLPTLNDVWEAHKLRNRIAHEVDFRLSRDTAERALSIYEQTFKDLGILD